MPRYLVTHTPEQIARAREVHMRGGTQGAVGAVLGVSQQSAGRRIREWGWPKVRRAPRPVPKFRLLAAEEEPYGRMPEGAQARRDAEDGLPDKHLHRPAEARPPELAARLRALIGREMTRIECCGGPPVEVARTLALLARTLKLVSALPDPGETWDEQDIEAYECELAEKLNALADEAEREEAAAAS